MPEHKSLAAALLAFHKNPPHIALDSTNPHFRNKFASFQGVTAATRPRLVDEGLVIAQPLSQIDGAPALTTILLHPASGEQIAETTPLLMGGKNDPQTWGSAITYAKRYGWLSILGLVGDEDDDAHAATTNGKAAKGLGAGAVSPEAAPPPADDIEFAPDMARVTIKEGMTNAEIRDSQKVPPGSFEAPGDGITDKQLKFLKMLASKLVKSEDDPLDVDAFRAELDGKYGVTATSALTKDQAKEVITSLKERALAAGLIEERA